MTIISVRTEVNGMELEFVDSGDEVFIKHPDGSYCNEFVVDSDNFDAFVDELVKYRTLRTKNVHFEELKFES